MKKLFLLCFCLSTAQSDYSLLEAVENDDFYRAGLILKSVNQSKLPQMINFRDSLGERLRVSKKKSFSNEGSHLVSHTKYLLQMTLLFEPERSVFYKAMCLNSSTTLSESQAEERTLFLNKTFPFADFDSFQIIRPHYTVFDCLFRNYDTGALLLLLDRLNSGEVWTKEAKRMLIKEGLTKLFKV